MREYDVQGEGICVSQIKARRKYIACCVGTIVMLGLSLGMILLLPVFILNEYFSVEYSQTLIIILIGFITFTGALTAGYLAEDETQWIPVLSSGVYWTLQLFISISFFDGLSLHTLYSFLSCTIGCFAAWLLLKKGKKSHSKRKKRRGNR